PSPESDEIELEEIPDEPRRATRDETFSFELQETAKISPSLTTPAAPATQPKDSDKALVNVALGILRLQGWPCREEAGYKSFTMHVTFKTAAQGVIAEDDFR